MLSRAAGSALTAGILVAVSVAAPVSASPATRSAPMPVEPQSTCTWYYSHSTSHPIVQAPRVDSARIGTMYPNTSAPGLCASVDGGSYGTTYGCGYANHWWVALYNISGYQYGYIETTCVHV